MMSAGKSWGDIMPDPIDVHVGNLIRQRRRLLGLSQTDLAATVGVRFQQMQKYETGFNRVSASRLYKIAQTLDVPVEFFFEGLNKADAETSGSKTEWLLEANKETLKLVRDFNRLPGGQRAKISALVQSLSE